MNPQYMQPGMTQGYGYPVQGGGMASAPQSQPVLYQSRPPSQSFPSGPRSSPGSGGPPPAIPQGDYTSQHSMQPGLPTSGLQSHPPQMGASHPMQSGQQQQVQMSSQQQLPPTSHFPPQRQMTSQSNFPPQPQLPPQQPPLQAHPGHLAGQMANLNINGVHRPPQMYPPQQGSLQNMHGGLTKPGGYPQSGGFPPQVNGGGGPPNIMNGMGGQMPQQGYPAPGGFPQQQPRRLDPDHMPSPMQVMQEDQRTKSGAFYTNQKGQVPPLVTTDFVVHDQGNASPRFIRSTMYSVPITSDTMKQTAVPFGIVLSPMAELHGEEATPPVVDMGELGPVRCIRCKAYICPNMKFIDGGRRFYCLLCKATTEVPGEYFQHLDHTGQRVDRFERAELVLGAYEFVATKEYCKENTFPKPPALIFVIDVSYNNVKSGLVHLACTEMRRFLEQLPKEAGQERSPMRVGFITYNTAVHFYNVSASLGQPQMLVVGDTQEMFMPLLDGFLVDPVESAMVIDTLMQQIPTMFAETRETETILAPAIQAGLEALKASGCAGKLLVFHSTLPTAEAPGKLKNRDDRKVLGTDKEKTVLTPQNTVYNNLGQDCVAAGCSVDLFIFNNAYIDLATVGQVCRLTGGEVFKYTYFQADLDGERLISDVERCVSRLCAFEAIMRVRTSTGIRPTDFYGHFFMSNTTDVEFACIDPDKAIGVEIKHDDKLTEDEGVYIQAALLYTSISGVRKIRVLNLALKSCAQMADLYRACELDTLINFFAKQALYRLGDVAPKSVKEGLVSRCAQILACYRKNCASPTSAGQLILPECMKLLPLYVNCLLKSDALSGGSDMTVDDRWFTMAAVTTMDIPSSVGYFYPRLIALHDLESDDSSQVFPMRCSAEKLADHGVYLLENGIYMFLWLGLSVASDWVMSVFGVNSTLQVDTERSSVPVLDNPLSLRVRSVISSIARARHRSMRLTVVRQREKMEVVMKHFLVEDQGLDGTSSYVDFLCHMHKEIRSILS